MILISLPDVEKFHPILTIGKDYPILRMIGNGVVIQPDIGKDKLLILASRFKEKA
jgi:hypothetical protein